MTRHRRRALRIAGHDGWKPVVWIAASLLISGIGVDQLGWQPAAAMYITICIHEFGHWSIWKAADVPAWFFASPFLGFCMPRLREGDAPLTTMGYGILYLAGCFTCLLTSAAVLLLRAVSATAADCEFLEIFATLPLLLNLLNLGILLPITDGGRCFMLLASRGTPWRRGLVGCAGLMQGAAVCVATRLVTGILWVGLSVVLLVTSIREPHPMFIADDHFRPWQLLILWAGLLIASAGLLMIDPFGRYLIKCII